MQCVQRHTRPLPGVTDKLVLDDAPSRETPGSVLAFAHSLELDGHLRTWALTRLLAARWHVFMRVEGTMIAGSAMPSLGQLPPVSMSAALPTGHSETQHCLSAGLRQGHLGLDSDGGRTVCGAIAWVEPDLSCRRATYFFSSAQ